MPPGEMTAGTSEHTTIDWYRVPLGKDTLKRLNQRSDLKGLVQTVAHLGLLVLTGGLAVYGVGRWPWWALVVLVFVHGTFFHFLLNGFHELCHGTVFKTRWLNEWVLRLFSLLGWHNYVVFRASHQRHHRYTLHPPYDGEVTLPIRWNFARLVIPLIFDWRAMVGTVRVYLRHSMGMVNNAWEERLFPADKPGSRDELKRWSRIALTTHIVWALVCVCMGWGMLLIVTSFPRAYGNWLNFLVNDTQHVGLRDNVPDFRLCARTIELNPFLAFLYWRMQYHIEHHMYAAVPFYNLPRLNAEIKDQLPPSPRGLVAAWRLILEILKRQEADPAYQYHAPLPAAAGGPLAADLTAAPHA